MFSPFELIYYIGYRIHRKTKKVFQKRLKGYTISVGNLTLGGTGKTPMVIAIASEAIRRGFKTCILTRGYKGKANSLIVSCGNGPETGWRDAGDEPYLMAKKLKNVWIVKDNNRYRGGLLAGQKDLYILDDGFQHWSLYRNLDIVLIDGTNPFGNGKLLPFGPLREPLDALKRASMVVITKVHEPDPELEKRIREINSTVEIFTATVEPIGLYDIKGQHYPLDFLKDKNVFVFCGIGNPKPFIETLHRLSNKITGIKRFRDHHEYSYEELKSILKKAHKSGAEVLVTTEKDFLKLEGLTEESNIYSLNVSMHIKDSQRYFDKIFENIKPNNELIY